MSTYLSASPLAQTSNDATIMLAQSAAAAKLTLSHLITGGVALAIIVSLLIIYLSVRKASGWSLSEALSEEIENATIIEKIASTYKPDAQSDNGNLNGAIERSAKSVLMKASSSRLIALFGAIAILLLYIGSGLAVLQKFIETDSIPDAALQFKDYYLYGMVLFAPYIVNKFSSIFEWYKPRQN